MITTLCYLEKDNKYLMLHRTKKENDINKNKWLEERLYELFLKKKEETEVNSYISNWKNNLEKKAITVKCNSFLLNSARTLVTQG